MADTDQLGAWDIDDDETDEARCPYCGASGAEECDIDCGDHDDEDADGD